MMAKFLKKWVAGIFLVLALAVSGGAADDEVDNPEKSVAETPATLAPVETSLEDFLLREEHFAWLAGTLAALVAVVGIYFARRRITRAVKAVMAADDGVSYTRVGTPDARGQGRALELPFHMFPSEWLDGVDSDAMRLLVQHTKTQAVDAFFEGFGDGVPTSARIGEARQRMANRLNNSMTDAGVFMMFNHGETLDDRQVGFLRQHLNELMPTLKISGPRMTDGMVRWWVLALNAALGALLGMWLVGTMTYWGLGSADGGIFFGAAGGAFLAVAGSLFVATRPAVRRWLLVITGGAALTDAGLQLLKSRLPAFLGGRKSGFLKRVLVYVGAAFALLLLKPAKTYDRTAYREQLETEAELWIRALFPLIATLMFRGAAAANPFNPLEGSEKTLVAVVRIAQDMSRYQHQTGGKHLEYAVAEMLQTLEIGGFQMPKALSVEPGAASSAADVGEVFRWEPDMTQRYDMFGLIRPGENVVVEQMPVIQDEKIIKKGLVRKHKGD